MRTLEDKVVMITGAKGGLGTFVTQACLNAGADVAGISRSIQDADFPSEAFTAFPAELSTSESARSVVDRVQQRYGRVDSLIHLLGGYAGGTTVGETRDDVLDTMLNLNLRSAFYIIRAVLPYFRAQKRGRIVAVGSRAAVEASAGSAAYSASKAALVALIRAVAAENADHCVSANIVLPGSIDTPVNRKTMPNSDFSRWVQPEQVASLIVSLSGDALSQVNGAAIPVYGRDL